MNSRNTQKFVISLSFEHRFRLTSHLGYRPNFFCQISTKNLRKWNEKEFLFAKFQQKILENWMKKKMLSMLMMEGCWRDFCQGCWLNLVATQYSSWFDLKRFKFFNLIKNIHTSENQLFSLNILRRRKMKSDRVTLCCVNSILTTSKSWIRFHFAGST